MNQSVLDFLKAKPSRNLTIITWNSTLFFIVTHFCKHFYCFTKYFYFLILACPTVRRVAHNLGCCSQCFLFVIRFLDIRAKKDRKRGAFHKAGFTCRKKLSS